MKITYKSWAPRADALAIVAQAETICAEYAARGYILTLRQLYYQFVARALIPNTDQSYKRLGSIINDARMAGLLSWRYLEDRTRNLAGTSHWEDPGSVIDSAAYGYRLDKWADQPRRVEVWVEKEALAGVIARIARELDVDYFSCRGYVSQSEQWNAGQRFQGYIMGGQAVTVLHLGDHDPSGLDMTRDIRDRLETFVGWRASNIADDGIQTLEVRRIALNMDQVEQYNPPPNPAKVTDSRSDGYMAEHGDQSWELDALDPDVLADLIRGHVEGIRDDDLYNGIAEREERERRLLRAASTRWDELVAVLDDED